VSHNNYLAEGIRNTWDEIRRLFQYSMTSSIADLDSDPIAWGFPEATTVSCYRDTHSDLDCELDKL